MARKATALAAIVFGLMAQVAAADTRSLQKSGQWEAFGGTTTSGRKVCGVSTTQSNKYYSVKYFYGDDTFTIQMGSGRWRIENGAQQKLKMRFDANRAWEVTGTGMHFGDGDAGLEFTVARRELNEFMAEFRAGNALIISFDGSDAASWSLWLAGTNAVSQAFLRCVDGL